MPALTFDRSQVIALRWHRHQLDRAPGSGDPAALDVDLFDLGVQQTGTEGATWALAVRGLEPDDLPDGALAFAWTLRGAPHAYRRRDLAEVAVATAPWSEVDAAKRIFDASKPLRTAGIPVLDALRTVADHLRTLAAEPIAKGDASGALNELVAAPFLRDCRPCEARHIYELPFRLAALQAGLELRAGTSPPILERVPGLEPNRLEHLAGDASPRFDVARQLLRFFPGSSDHDLAATLDSPVKEVRAHRPADVVAVEVSSDGTGRSGWVLEDDVDALRAAGPLGDGTLRLLSGHDPYLQLRDRDLLLPDPDRRKAMWPVLGRPGAIVVDGEVVGVWRPKASGKRLTVRIDPWEDLAPHRGALEREAERLAAHRGVALAGLVDA
jgi:hypothetical protein